MSVVGVGAAVMVREEVGGVIGEWQPDKHGEEKMRNMPSSGADALRLFPIILKIARGALFLVETMQTDRFNCGWDDG